jgi:hypothetical protein
VDTLSARTTSVAALCRAVGIFGLTAYGVVLAAPGATCELMRGVVLVRVSEMYAVDAIVIHV